MTMAKEVLLHRCAVSSSAEGADAIKLVSAGKQLLVVGEKYIPDMVQRVYEIEDIVCHMPKMMVGSKTLHTDGMQCTPA